MLWTDPNKVLITVLFLRSVSLNFADRKTKVKVDTEDKDCNEDIVKTENDDLDLEV
jgi:hypothetical protein